MHFNHDDTTITTITTGTTKTLRRARSAVVVQSENPLPSGQK